MHIMADNKAREDWEVLRTFALDLAAGGKPRILLMEDDWERAGVTGATLQAIDIGQPGKIVMSTLDYSGKGRRDQTGTKLHDDRRDSGWTRNLYEVDVRTGHGRPLEIGTPYTNDWVVGADGKVVARSEWNGDTDDYSVLVKRGSGWTPVFKLDSGETPWLAGVTADGGAVVHDRRERRRSHKSLGYSAGGWSGHPAV